MAVEKEGDEQEEGEGEEEDGEDGEEEEQIMMSTTIQNRYKVVIKNH
jgi:hypothetical protein